MRWTLSAPWWSRRVPTRSAAEATSHCHHARCDQHQHDPLFAESAILQESGHHRALVDAVLDLEDNRIRVVRRMVPHTARVLGLQNTPIHARQRTESRARSTWKVASNYLYRNRR